MTRLFLAISLVLVLAGCASMKPSDFARERPRLEPDKYFTGHTHSSGVMENRAGAPTRRVTTETSGHWEGGTLHMEQKLTFGNGNTQRRSWRLRRLDAHHFAATANDILGTVRGEAYGNVFHWSFTLALSPGNPLANVRMSQWMYLQPDGRTMINHTTIRKAGLVVAQVTEAFLREENP